AAFWERLWRSAGIQFVVFFVLCCVIYGHLPGVHASADELLGFYNGERVRVLIAATLLGLNVLNLMWFAAALRSALADAGKDGWGAAATSSSAAFGAVFLVLDAAGAGLAYSIAGLGSPPLAVGLNHLGWALLVLSSFPRAMLIMSAAFGLWRAGLISTALFKVGVAAVVLGVLGGTTWMSDGFWAPDGIYSRFVCALVGVVWILIVGRALSSRGPASRSEW